MNLSENLTFYVVAGFMPAYIEQKRNPKDTATIKKKYSDRLRALDFGNMEIKRRN